MVDVRSKFLHRWSWVGAALSLVLSNRSFAAAGQLSVTFQPEVAGFFAGTPAPDGTAYVLSPTGAKLAHIDSHGQVLGDFHAGIGPNDGVSNFALDPAGRMYLTGIMKPDGASSLVNVVKLNPDGTPDLRFPAVNVRISSADDWWNAQDITAIAADGQGGCWIGGSFDSVNGKPAAGFAHVTPSGLSIEANPSNGSAGISFLARASDGIIIGAGDAFYERLDAGGQRAFDFQPPANGHVLAATFSDRFGLAIATTTSTVIRCQVYGADGKRRASFSDAVGFVKGTNSLAWDPQGRLLVCSAQLADYQVGPVPPGYGIKRLLADGSLDPSWNESASFSGGLQVAVPMSDGVLVSGPFTAIDGIPVGHVVKLSGDDTVSRSANQSVLGWVEGGRHPLTLGFVVRGEYTGEVLLRACAPSLQQFGVTDVPNQTSLKVYRGTELVYSASPGVQTSGPGHPYERSEAVRWATAVTGAFPLVANGYYEAEALLQLPPGAYTVTIDVPAGQAGQVLGELYFP